MLHTPESADASDMSDISQHVDDATWDEFIQSYAHAHILQTSAWARLKSKYGWHWERVTLADEAGNLVAGSQILFRKFPFLPYTIAYLAMGPYGEAGSMKELWRAIHRCARKRRAIYLKWEPDGCSEKDHWCTHGFIPSQETIQPPRTIHLHIEEEPALLLTRMNQSTRRKIRRSQRELTFREAAASDIPRFYPLLKQTAERNRFGIHPESYYEAAARSFLPDQAALILAERDGEAMAGVMTFALGRRAWYFYGASSASARKYAAGYGAQWAAILWAKARGCTVYDLWGIPDEEPATLEAQFKGRSDGLWGVYGFKRGWGGTISRSAGAWDYVYHPRAYHAFRWALKMRRRILS